MTPEEEFAHYKEVVVPALRQFRASLDWTCTIFERFPADAASLAATAAAAFVKNVSLDQRYMAPLDEAADIAAKKVPLERLLLFRRGAAVIRDPEKLRNKLPPLDEFRDDKVISKRDSTRIIAVVVVDLQRRCKVPLPEALQNVVGHNPTAAKRLENFRDILRRTKRGAKRELYDLLTADSKGKDLPGRAETLLALYRERIGKKRKPWAGEKQKP